MMQGFRPPTGNPPGVPLGSCRHEVRARLPLAAPDTVPPPLLVEIEVDDPQDSAVPPGWPDATVENRGLPAGSRHLALILVIAAVVVLLARSL